jgi:hypothetical protein
LHLGSELSDQAKTNFKGDPAGHGAHTSAAATRIAIVSVPVLTISPAASGGRLTHSICEASTHQRDGLGIG